MPAIVDTLDWSILSIAVSERKRISWLRETRPCKGCELFVLLARRNESYRFFKPLTNMLDCKKNRLLV